MDTILIIEKEHSIRRALNYALQRTGYEVYEAESFTEGYDLLRSISFDGLIINYENLEKERLPYILSYSIPVIFLTDLFGMPSWMVKNLPEFAYQFTLPFQLKAFLSQVEAAIKKRTGKQISFAAV